MTHIVKGGEEGQYILDAASSHITNYDLPDHEPFRAVFYFPFRNMNGGFYEEISDTVQIFGSTDKNDRRLLERESAHEKLHAAIQKRLVGPLDSEVRTTFNKMRMSRKRISDRLSQPPFTREVDGKELAAQMDWALHPRHPRIFSYFKSDGLEKCFESSLEKMLLEDEILQILDSFEEDYSDQMPDNKLIELTNSYEQCLESQKYFIEDRKDYLLDSMLKRRSKVRTTSHPAEEAIVALFSQTKPTSRDIEDLGSSMNTEEIGLEDIGLDNPEYINIKILQAASSYDKADDDTLYDDNDRTVESWMREFYSLYREKRNHGISEEESFNETFYHALEDVLEPYAEEQLEQMDKRQVEV